MARSIYGTAVYGISKYSDGNIVSNTSIDFTSSTSLKADGQLQSGSSLIFTQSGSLTGFGKLTSDTDLTFSGEGFLTSFGMIVGNVDLDFSLSGIINFHDSPFRLTTKRSVEEIYSIDSGSIGLIYGTTSGTFPDSFYEESV